MDGAVGRQETYEHRRAAHDEDDNGEGGPASYPIAQVAPEHPPYGTRQERDAVERERRDYGRGAIPFGEEKRGNDRDRVRVDREVVPLHKVANTPRRQRPYGTAGAPGRLTSSFRNCGHETLLLPQQRPETTPGFGPLRPSQLSPSHTRLSRALVLQHTNILWCQARQGVSRVGMKRRRR